MSPTTFNPEQFAPDRRGVRSRFCVPRVASIPGHEKSRIKIIVALFVAGYGFECEEEDP